MSLTAVTPPRIALKAGMLLVAARLGFMPMQVAIDPSAPITISTPAFAHWLGLAGRDGEQPVPHHADIEIDHVSFALRKVKVALAGGRAQMVVGADILRQAIVEVDIPHGRLYMLDQRAARSREKSMEGVDTQWGSDGCLLLLGATKDGRAVRAAMSGRLDVGNAGEKAMVAVNGLRLSMASHHDGCRGSDVVAGWNSFDGRTVLFDLGNDRLWVSRVAADTRG